MTGSPADDPQDRLTQERIVRAAIALIDAEGLPQLTMRRLGTVLGVEAMALYRYFPSRRRLIDGLVDAVVNDVATDPAVQFAADDDWRDYLDRLAHGIRRMALAHPRVFPLVATHPTEAPWIRPPLRSLAWVEGFLAGLLDHHFPPPAAVLVYKQFSTFLLGHLLLEVAGIGLDHPDRLAAPPAPPDRDRSSAEDRRDRDATLAEQAMPGTSAPSAEDIRDSATARPKTVAEEPAVTEALPAAAAAAGAETPGSAEAVRADLDVPVAAAVVATDTLPLTGFPHVAALAGLLAQDTAGTDFDRNLDSLLVELEPHRRP